MITEKSNFSPSSPKMMISGTHNQKIDGSQESTEPMLTEPHNITYR